jgi:transcriptional regulator with XRE-family HTH domain
MATETHRTAEKKLEDTTPATAEMAAATTTDTGRVATEAAESFISEKRLGERIKHLRTKKGMGLVEVGRHTGLSASFLSQLETGRVVPTLRNLARIALVFSKDLSYFFEPEPKTLFRVQRAKDRIRLPQSGTDDPVYYFESLGYLVPDRQLDPYFAEFLANVKPRRAHQHPGCEFLYVLEGELEIVHGESKHVLAGGDAVYFDANTPHSYCNAGEAPAKALIVTLQGNAASRTDSAGSAGLRRPAVTNGAVIRPRITDEPGTQTTQ